MINTQVLKGNLIRQDYTTAFVLNQGDKGVPFKIELLENGAPYILQSTDIVTIEWLKPNGSPFLKDTGITKGDTYVEITTPEAISQSSGSGTFNIIISDGTTRKGTIKREYKVESPVEVIERDFLETHNILAHSVKLNKISILPKKYTYSGNIDSKFLEKDLFSEINCDAEIIIGMDSKIYLTILSGINNIRMYIDEVKINKIASSKKYENENSYTIYKIIKQ